jgi:hypothetical protein
MSSSRKALLPMEIRRLFVLFCLSSMLRSFSFTLISRSYASFWCNHYSVRIVLPMILPIFLKSKGVNSFFSRFLERYPINDDSTVKEFIMPNSLNKTMRAVFILEGSILNLQEWKRNMCVASESSFGNTRSLK